MNMSGAFDHLFHGKRRKYKVNPRAQVNATSLNPYNLAIGENPGKPILVAGVGNSNPIVNNQIRTPVTVISSENDNEMYLVSDTLKTNKEVTLSGASGHWYMLLHPSTILSHMYDVLKGTGSYVIWNYHDFVEQFHSWNGTLTGLLEHTALVWRMFVTIVLTLGLFELSSVMASLWGILVQLGNILRSIFSWVTGITSEMFYIIGLLWDDAVSIFHAINPFD